MVLRLIDVRHKQRDSNERSRLTVREEAVLKRSQATVVSIVVLSLGVWYFFYVVSGVPLTLEETVLVVGISALVVLAARRMWSRLRELKARK